MNMYTLSCNDCPHEWAAAEGCGVNARMMATWKCPKCDGSLTVEKAKDAVIESVNTSKSATIVAGTGASDFKDMPADWKNFLSGLHRNTRGSNMKDRF